jgi:galactokinase
MPPALERAVEAYCRRYGSDPEVVMRAPGRATLLGAHIDYSEGWVLPAAIERSTYVAAGRREERSADLCARDLDAEARLDLDRLPSPVAQRQGAPSDWSDYAAGVAWALAEIGLQATGINAVISGDLPMASGLSSSAALESALVLAWEALSEWRLEPTARARIGHRAEAGYLGLNSGIMDQFVVLHARPTSAVFLDCRSLEHEVIPLPESARLVVADSGIGRRLVDSQLNSRREQCRQAVESLRVALPGIATLRDVSPAELTAHHRLLPPPLDLRARHVVGECRRARLGAAALHRQDLAELGRLMRLSHESSRDLYQVSLEELDLLAEAAWETPGCHGARFSGAGFGGCVAALVTADSATRVAKAMEDRFEQRFGRRPSTFTTRFAAGAGPVEPTSSDRPERRTRYC